MEFRILGPLEVVEGGRALTLGGARQRAVLALLLTRPNEVVSADRLVDDLWGSDPPRTAANTVQQYVSQLRKLLGSDRIATRPPGYALRVEPGELDLDRFEALVKRGDAEALREAFTLWRGAPLADLAYEPFAQSEIARLGEVRVAALEKRIDADLALGQDAELVGELEGLIAEHPLRERFRGQLMLALYRSGRQAEALAAYRSARATLVGELGIEPSAALQELERAILRQDPSLQTSRTEIAASSKRSLLVAPFESSGLGALLALAEPLAERPRRELILVGLLPGDQDPARATAELAARREELRRRGVDARVAAYRSTSRGADVAVLAVEQDVDLVLVDASPSLLDHGTPDGDLESLLLAAPCDVGLLVKPESLRTGSGRPVVVPFGGVEHDWSAVEIAAWLARSLGVSLRLAGTEADDTGRPDAGRLLARASLAVQAAVGIVAEPALVALGAEGMLEASQDASLLVMGLSERWRTVGLGQARLVVARDSPTPTLLVRHGLRPGGLAPPESATQFTWTLGAA
jgi:DNA-binding SARP family transcriptional activator